MRPSHPRIHTACSREGIFFLLFLMGLGGAALYTAKNALILLFCFFIFTLLATLYIGRKNVASLRLNRRFQDEFFAGEEAHIDLLVHNPGKHTHYALHLYEDFEQDRTIGPIFIPSLKPDETSQAQYDCIFHHRGTVRFRQLQVRSRFPLPFFEFRAIYPCEMRHTVYPSCDPGRDRIFFSDEIQTPKGGGFFRNTRFQELEHGHQRGHIQWKLSARRGTFIETVDHHVRHQSAMTIDFKSRADLPPADFERQISQLTDCCLKAFSNGTALLIRSPDHEIAPKRQDILEFLAHA